MEETKMYNEDDTEYIDIETDKDIVNKFCMLTNYDKNVAVSFLNVTQWDIQAAVCDCYTYNGDITALYQNKAINMSNAQMNISYSNQQWKQLHTECNTLINMKSQEFMESIYNHGVEFWYWDADKTNKICIVGKYDTMKDEILNFKRFSMKQWNQLYEECKMLMNVDKITEISSNGNNAMVYKINFEDRV
eukprot:78879_1